MNNWRDIKTEVPSRDVEFVRVKYFYQEITHKPLITSLLFDISEMYTPNMTSHIGVDIIHIDSPYEDAELGVGGFRFSDLKGEHQLITHWMPIDEPYEPEEV